jgi:hypothetical protein
MQNPLRAILLACLLAPGLVARAGDARYFGLEVPRGLPMPFEPATLAAVTGPTRPITGPAFSPDFRRFVFTVADAVYESRRPGDEPSASWSAPAPIQVLTQGGYSAGESIFSRDGRWLYFSSSRPPGAPGLKPRIFRAAVKANGFGPPAYVPIEPPPYNDNGGGTFYPRPLADGSMAFTSPGPVGRDDLFVAPGRANGFGPARALEGDFNSAQDDWDLVETAGGDLRIWVSSRPGGAGRTDIYYSRRDAAGHWSSARNLEAANSPALETAPQLSPDDRVLFFLRYTAGAHRLYWVELSSMLEPP